MANALDYLERLAASRLLPESKVTELRADASLVSLAPKELAGELVRRKLISKYQSRVILRSANARFDYGAYRVVGRHTDGFRTGMFQAAHRLNQRRVEFDRFDLTVDAASDPTFTEIQHPNLTCCLERFEEGTHACIVFEPVSGESLAEKLERGSLPLSEVLSVVRQVADACWELHTNGLAHGMICPAAVMVDESGDAKLLWRPGRTLTDNDAVGERLQSLAAPFSLGQIAGSDTAADVYSLGKLLQQLVESLDFVPEDVVQVIEGATNKTKNFSHAGVLVALLTRDASMRDSAAVHAATADDRAVASTQANIRTSDSVPTHSPVESLEFSAEGASQADRLRERRQASRRKQILWGGIAALLTVVGGWLIAREFVSESSIRPEVITSNSGATGGEAASAPSNAVGGEAVANDVEGDHSTGVDGQTPGDADNDIGNDDGESLWLSPTSGGPVDLSLLPPNSQLYIHFRPSAILSNPQSLRALNALGPSFRSKRADWEKTLGVRWDDLESVAAAIVPQDARSPEFCWLIRPTASWTPPQSWSRGRASQVHDQTLVQLGDRVVWDSGNGFVIGREPVVQQAIESRMATSLLRRQMEQMRHTTDEQHLFSTLFVPRFLAAEGRKLIAPQTVLLLDEILASMGDETRVCALGLHVDNDQFFGELRFVADNDGGASQRSREFGERIRRVPQDTELAIARLPSLDGYWRRLALRSVQMMQFAEKNIRVSSERRSVISNISLPPAAAHNLFMAIELVTAATQSAPTNITGVVTLPTRSISMEDLLQKRMTIDIPQQSIEFALRDIAEQVNADLAASDRIQIRIDGPALQAEGITRNQQIREFQRTDAAFAEILTGLVMKANPVTTVTSPSELDQKLVWVRFNEPSQPDRRIILITTRTAATEKSYSLPSDFRRK